MSTVDSMANGQKSVDRLAVSAKVQFHRRIKTKLLFVLLVLAILPMALLAAYAIDTAETSYEKAVTENLAATARVVHGRIADSLTQGESQLAAWAAQRDTRVAPTVADQQQVIFTFMQQRFRAFLADQVSQNSLFVSLYVVKPAIAEEGAADRGDPEIPNREELLAAPSVGAQIVYASSQRLEGKELFDGFWVKANNRWWIHPSFRWKAGESALVTIDLPDRIGTPVVVLAHPFDDANGHPMALVGLIHPEALARTIAETMAGAENQQNTIVRNQTNLLLVDGAQKVLASHGPRSGVSTANAIVQRDRHESILRYEVLGFGDSFVGLYGAPKHFQIAALQDAKLVLAPMHQMRLAIVGATVLLGIIISIFATAMARSITDPIRQLVGAAARATHGDLSQRIEITTRDEIGQLAEAFGVMIRRLRDSFDVLEQQNQDLKELDELKTQFLANTSHELRTPLNGIIGLLEASKEGAYGALAPSQARSIEMALSSARRLKNLVGNLLSFSAGERGGVKNEMSPLSLSTLIENEIFPGLGPMFLAKRLKLSMTAAENLPMVMADREQMIQLFTNLIGNALKFTETGGVEVAVAMADDASGHLHITVSDSGIGISAEAQSHIFDVFYQVDGSATRRYEGTGLGLAIARQIIERHLGRIWVESAAGQGTTFHCTIPVAEVGMGSSAAAVSVSIEPDVGAIAAIGLTPTDEKSLSVGGSIRRQRNKELIVVIDDEPINVEVLRAFLEHAGYEVAGYTSPREGLDAVLSNPCDLVLLDVMMPELSGYDVCRALKDDRRSAHVPVIFLSAQGEIGSRIRGLELGALDYLVKPFDRLELQTKLRTFLDLRALQHQLEDLNVSLEQKVEERTRELANEKAKVEALAMQDALTGLPNRRVFEDRLERNFVRSRREEGPHYAVAFVDVDNFKLINDSLGHRCGDQVIAEVGRRLQQCVRAGDTVARFGGDEFTLLLCGLKKIGDADVVFHRILDIFKDSVEVDGQRVFVTLSIGAALSDPTYAKPDNLIRDADTALYRAKANGKGRFELFHREMHETARKRFEMESDLRDAISSNQLTLHYQPIIRVETGRLSHFEALIRWKHPEKGMVPPLSFLPTAEETGLIVPIGNWVLTEVCRQIKQWHATHGVWARVSLNVSAKQFVDRRFLEHFAETLRAEALPRHSVCIEVTEGALIHDFDRAVHILNALKELDAQIHLDDFGTGYSSLAYLYRLPIHGLKIDRSFVNKMIEDPRAKSIVNATLMLASHLGLEAVAEGVETNEQLNALRSLGCVYVQGYYFSKPVDAGTAGSNLMGWLAGADDLGTKMAC